MTRIVSSSFKALEPSGVVESRGAFPLAAPVFARAGWKIVKSGIGGVVAMDVYVLTALGRKAIPGLRRLGKELDAGILEFLERTEGATENQVAEAFKIDIDQAYDKLRSLSANRWVWRRTTRVVPF